MDSTFNDTKLEENMMDRKKGGNNNDKLLSKKSILKSNLLLTEPDIFDQTAIQDQNSISYFTRRSIENRTIILRY